MKTFIVSFAVLLMSVVSAPADGRLVHPFYVSVTEINHNSKTNNLEISCKMFYDDLQIALRQLYKRSVDLSNKKNEADNDKMLSQYLLSHFSMSSDAKNVGLKYLGFEIERESVFCYFEADNVSAPKKLVLTNKILQDYKEEQQNIMHVVVNGNRKSTKTDTQTPQATITF